MDITFINVGYGESILITCADPENEDGQFVMLIDGGSGEEEEFAGSTSGRRPLIDFLRDQHLGHLDLLVNTHIHEDTPAGFFRLQKHTVPHNSGRHCRPVITGP